MNPALGKKKKRGKSIEFDRSVIYSNITKHNDHITPKKKVKTMVKRRKSESAKTDTEEVERTYVIDRLNICEAKHY